MTLTIDWTAIAAVAAAVSTAIAVIALLLQSVQLRRSIQSSVYQQMVSMFDDFSKLVVEHPRSHALIFAPSQHASLFGEDSDSVRARWSLGIHFNWFESIVIQRKRFGAVPNYMWNHWVGILRLELEAPGLGEYFHTDLRDCIDTLLQDTDPNVLTKRSTRGEESPRT